MEDNKNYYEFEVLGEIKGKERPRYNPCNYNSKKPYTPPKTKYFEYEIKFQFTNKYPEYKPLEGRIRATIVSQFQVPKSTSKIKTKEMLEERISPTKKPDIDNITKIVLDALNKIAYKDDTQVTELMVQKVYGTQEKTYVKIEEY